MAQRYFSEVNMQRFDEEDSDHSVNGWIKKEIDDDDDMEDYIKQAQEADPGDHYEELINLNKEELVGRVLQQEEDIRYLQDIRNGLEKAVQDLSGTVPQFQTLFRNMSAIVSSLKEHHVATSDNAMPTSTISSSRPPEPSTRAAETSPRATPSSSSNILSSTLTSPKPVPAPRNNTRTESTTQSYMTTSTVVPSKERTQSVNTHSTVTITKSTNLIIKTEVPSPPPETELLENMVQSSGSISMGQMGNYPKKRKFEAQSTFQSNPLQSQQHQNSNSNPSFSPVQASNRGIGQRPKANIAVNSPQQQQQQQHQQQAQQRARANFPMPPAARNSYPMQNVQQGQMRPQPAQNIRMPSPRFQRGSPRMMRGRGGFQDVSFPGQVQRAPRAAATMQTTLGRPRHVSTVKITQLPTTTSSPPVNTMLKEIQGKLPEGMSLSLVSPAGSASKGPDTTPRSMTIKSADIADRSSASSTFTSSSSKAVTGVKNVTSAPISSTSTSSSNQGPNVIVFGEEDDDENDYDEIAVLIPDKKNSLGEEESDSPSRDSQASLKKNARAAEMFSQESSSPNWPSQNSSVDQSNQNASSKMYHNNDEYMFDEPLDDTDIDESDPKIYLGEDIYLPREVVENCIKESPNPDQLIRSLMDVLFPTLSQLAANCDSAVDGNKAYTILPTNRVNAVIALVQKRFPLCKRNVIFGVVNQKFLEAKTNVRQHNRTPRAVQYKQY